MKALFVVPYIYDKRYVEFTKNPTGFGMLTAQIFEYVSEGNETYLMSHVLTKGHGNILSHTVLDIIRHVRLKDIIQGARWATQYRQNFKDRLKYCFFCLNKGYACHTIKTLRPDIVHINSVGMRSKVFIEVCEELGQKYVLTLHGLIGLDDSVQAPKWDKEYEKEVLVHCEEKSIPVTVISTGIKNRIEKHYLGKPSRSITVVTNGTDVTPADGDTFGDLREKYNIPENGKIAVAVGNLCKRKNQVQLVQAIATLKQKYNQDLYVFFCGRDVFDGKVQQQIELLKLNDRVFLLGFVSPQCVKSIYQQANLNILASIDEGFGLSIIEAFVCGLPTVTFADLDAIPDLYDERTMQLCESRNTEAFAEAIAKAMDKEWDAEYIRTYSKKFSLEKMAENYVRVYEKSAK